MKCERGTARKRACPKIDVESVRHLDKRDLSLEVFSFRNSFGHPSEEKFTKSLSYKWTQGSDVVRGRVLVPLRLGLLI